MVDDEDFEWLNQWKWQASVVGGLVYAVRRERLANGLGNHQKMHRQILGLTDPEILGEHADGNGLNNQRYNLRVATHSQNAQNRRVCKSNTTGYKGVGWYKRDGKFVAKYMIRRRYIHLGYFDSKEEAARHYNQAAHDNGEGFAFLNKVDPLFPTTQYVTGKEIRVSKTTERTEKYLSDFERGVYGARYKGLTFDKDRGKWRVIINKKHVGMYVDRHDAIVAWAKHQHEI